MQCYADDTQLSLTFRPEYVINASEKINEDLKSILDYSSKNNLRTKFFQMQRNIFLLADIERCYIGAALQIKLDNQPLDIVHKVKNLELIFESDLRFKEHVKSLVKKCYVALKLLYTNISIINFKLRKKLVETLVLPILNYCNIVYYPCLDRITKNRIQVIQNSCCRFVYRLRKYDHISSKK